MSMDCKHIGRIKRRHMKIHVHPFDDLLFLCFLLHCFCKMVDGSMDCQETALEPMVLAFLRTYPAGATREENMCVPTCFSNLSPS